MSALDNFKSSNLVVIDKDEDNVEDLLQKAEEINNKSYKLKGVTTKKPDYDYLRLLK